MPDGASSPKSDPQPREPDKNAPHCDDERDYAAVLKMYEHNASNDDIKVTFEVLLSPEMNFPKSKVFIVFGPPLSDWKALMVEMAVKPGTSVIDPGNYRYLVSML
jgi:hypothetical protein